MTDQDYHDFGNGSPGDHHEISLNFLPCFWALCLCDELCRPILHKVTGSKTVTEEGEECRLIRQLSVVHSWSKLHHKCVGENI